MNFSSKLVKLLFMGFGISLDLCAQYTAEIRTSKRLRAKGLRERVEERFSKKQKVEKDSAEVDLSFEQLSSVSKKQSSQESSFAHGISEEFVSYDKFNGTHEQYLDMLEIVVATECAEHDTELYRQLTEVKNVLASARNADREDKIRSIRNLARLIAIRAEESYPPGTKTRKKIKGDLGMLKHSFCQRFMMTIQATKLVSELEKLQLEKAYSGEVLLQKTTKPDIYWKEEGIVLDYKFGKSQITEEDKSIWEQLLPLYRENFEVRPKR